MRLHTLLRVLMLGVVPSWFQGILILFVLFSLDGCDLGEPPSEITTDFRLRDTSGTEATRFRTGENFDMQFALTNASGTDQYYHYTGVPVVFEIYSADTIVATSVDGMGFHQIILEGRVRNGDTFRSSWRAPNSRVRDPGISLPPGSYQAVVRHEVFLDKIRVPQTKPVGFTVIGSKP